MVHQEFNKKEVKSFANQAGFPATGTADVIYIDKNTNTPFYWNGSAYVPLSSPAADTVSVYVQSSSTTKPSPAVESDTLIITDNGLATGTITEQWIYDGTTWIQLPNDKVLDVLTTAQTPPTIGSIATTNLGKIYKGTDGNSYITDYSGESILLSNAIFAEKNQFHVDPNGSNTTGTGADEAPFLTVQKGIDTAGQADAVIVNEGTYGEGLVINTQNLTVRGQGQEYGGLTEVNSIASTANGTSVRVSSMTVGGEVTHSGSSPLYLSDMTVIGNYTSSSTAYSEIKGSRLQSGTIQKTAAGILFIQDSLIGNATFSTANSVISLRNVNIDAGKKVTIGAGVIYSMQDVVGEVEINAAAIPVETALLAQGLTAEQAKAAQTSSFNMLRMLDPDTNNSNTNVVSWNTTTKRLEVSALPIGGAVWYSGTNTPTATGNTASSLGVATLPANYYNTETGNQYYVDANGVSKLIEKGYITTSLTPVLGNGTAYVGASNTALATVADQMRLSDGSIVDDVDVTWVGHPYSTNIHQWFY